MLPPTATYEMVKLKIEEEVQQAARERRAREAVRSRPHAIDSVSVGERIRIQLFGRGRPRPAGA